jgi:anti-sigma regulatory factor (Ser/Thr protein kinase)
VLWRTHALPFFENVSGKAHAICQYGFTEMINNAIDHSEGTEVFVRLTRTAGSVRMVVVDDGVGIYRKIKNALNLEDERHAILELSKGKFTTDRERHTGHGIYFTSRAFDEFGLASGGITLTHIAEVGDWLGGHDDAKQQGTFVEMVISQSTRRTMQDVYRAATAPDNPGFSRTTVPVGLAEYGDAAMVSRSQAKRVVLGLNKFQEVIFDFKDVSEIGQAFADEIFRVYQAEYPNIRLRWMNANENVKRMIAFVTAPQPQLDQGGGGQSA